MKFRPKVPGWWPYILLFCLALGMFMAVFYVEAKIWGAVANLEKLAAKNGITLEERQISWLPPRLDVKKIIYVKNGTVLEMQDARLTPGIFPFSLNFQARFMGGPVAVMAEPDSIFRAEKFKVEFSGKNIALDRVFGIFADASRYAEIKNGKIKFSGNLDIAVSGGNFNWSGFAGAASLELDGVEIVQKVPILKDDVLKGAAGSLELGLEGRNCQVRHCAARAGDISLEAQGTIERWMNAAGSSLNLESTLRVPVSALREELIPGRTLDLLKKNGFILARISRSLASPRLQLAE